MIIVLVQSLALASVGIISPGSITIVILLLMSDRGWPNGVAYMLGYISMYSLIGVAVLTLGVRSAENSKSEQSVMTSIVLIILGMLLLGLTWRNWRKPRTENNKPSRFTHMLDSVTPIKAFVFAAMIAVINFKNLAIFLTAVSIPLLSDLPIPTKLIILIPVVLVFCTSVIVPILIYITFPQQANNYLIRIKQGIEIYSHPLGLVVTLILSFLFFYRGISGL